MTRERTATDSFADIRELFESKLDSNQELGASIALDIGLIAAERVAVGNVGVPG